MATSYTSHNKTFLDRLNLSKGECKFQSKKINKIKYLLVLRLYKYVEFFGAQCFLMHNKTRPGDLVMPDPF